MCGICGYKSFGEDRPLKHELESLLIQTMSRGRDATGVAFLDAQGCLRVMKDGVPAHDFIASELWGCLKDIPGSMIMHCRAATHGLPSNNMNNHPVFNKSGMAVVHNGIISNHDHLFQADTLHRDAEVDSEVILRLIERGWWDDMKNLERLSGSFACAFISASHPDELILVRHSSPIALFMDAERDILFWASTNEILKESLTKTHRGFRCASPLAYEMPDNTAALIGKDGVLKTEKLNMRPEHWDWRDNDDTSASWSWRDLGRDDKGRSNAISASLRRHDRMWRKHQPSKTTGTVQQCEVCRNATDSPIFIDGIFACEQCFAQLSELDDDLRCEYCGASLNDENEAALGCCYRCYGAYSAGV